MMDLFDILQREAVLSVFTRFVVELVDWRHRGNEYYCTNGQLSRCTDINFADRFDKAELDEFLNDKGDTGFRIRFHRYNYRLVRIA